MFYSVRVMSQLLQEFLPSRLLSLDEFQVSTLIIGHFTAHSSAYEQDNLQDSFLQYCTLLKMTEKFVPASVVCWKTFFTKSIFFLCH